MFICIYLSVAYTEFCSIVEDMIIFRTDFLGDASPSLPEPLQYSRSNINFFFINMQFLVLENFFFTLLINSYFVTEMSFTIRKTLTFITNIQTLHRCTNHPKCSNLTITYKVGSELIFGRNYLYNVVFKIINKHSLPSRVDERKTNFFKFV